MKNKISILALLATLSFTGCNDSFLDKYPVTDLTEENAFKSYDNFKSFMWPCYKMFSDKTIATSVHNAGQDSNYQGDRWAGYFGHKSPSGFNKYAFQTVGSVAEGNGWDFSSYIRRINIMLSHVDKSEMTEEERKHWRAVGYFFHSFWYMELIDRFGDVPWIDKVLTESSPEAYGPRTSRSEVAANILKNLKWAEENISENTSRDGKNTITKECIQVAISRFTLREATWRKYHGLGEYDALLDECTRVSKILIDKHPTLYNGTDGQPAAGYGEMWTTESLENIPGIILYKEYIDEIALANFSYLEHTSSHNIEMGQEIVDLYLMKNGKPIRNDASGYHGDKTMYTTYRNRDPRMYHVIMPPYKVKSGGGEYKTWSHTDNPADREYIDIMGANTSCSNPGIGMKRLPGQNWSAALVPEIPRLGTGAYVTCRSGYYVWKNWSNWEKSFNSGALNTSDKPIFKIEEIMLNYAEAMFEKGSFDQAIADMTINKLRTRAGVTPMNIAEIDASFDPNLAKYYPKGNDSGILLDPVLWEIRRERIIELMGEGFGFYDVRRWRMAPWFLNKTHKGIWIEKAKLPSGMTLLNESTGASDGVNGLLTEGYIYLYNNPLTETKGWLDKYYLYEVPSTEIILNPNLKPNNPGWE